MMETNIRGMFNLNPGQSNPVPNPPRIQYDSTLNKIIVTGDKAQLNSIRDILTKLNALKAPPAPTTPVEPGPGSTGQGGSSSNLGPVEDAMRTVTLKTGNASQYVDNLKYLLASLRANPVFVTLEPVMAQSIEDSRKGIKPKIDEKRVQLVEEEREIPQVQNKPGDPSKPVFIASLSRTNGVLIGSDDAEALDFAEQVLAYLTKEGDEYYEVIPLKNSNAEIVRTTLDELINGKRQQGGMGGFPFPMMGGGGNMRETITGPIVRLAADKRTNSILVRAPRQIVVTIRRFIETELDVNNIDQKLQPKPRIFKLLNADASEMASILKEIYKEYVETPSAGGPQPGMPFNPFMRQQPTAEPERSIRLSVAANTRDNSLIMNCPDILWPEIEALLLDMDKDSLDSTKQVKVINVGKADPVMLQRAVDAITGKKSGAAGQQQQQDPQAALRSALMNRFGGFGGFGMPGGGGPRMGGGAGGRMGGGGAGGGRGGRGGRNRSEEPPAILKSATDPGGKDFFADRVKEDPRTQVTFDSEFSNNQIVQAQAQNP
ncbi:MAG TPA: secretin N-terminal domain-containing protein, partial [Gemmatales bacterium]|nr:secretin N-terminal domain-containing protein [Gemmatales bacterium]